jgi:hypothetical protein
MMMHKATAQTEILVTELGALARQIDAGPISSASDAARDEWLALRAQWPSPNEVRAGAVPLSDDDLALMVAKVRRFKEILQALSPVVHLGIALVAPLTAAA